MRDGKKSSRNPGSAVPLRHRKRCNEVSTHGATKVNRYLLPSRHARARIQPHLVSIATIFPLLFSFTRRRKSAVTNSTCCGVASRFVTLGKLKFPTVFPSLLPIYLLSLLLFRSFPTLLVARFVSKVAFRSHWDKSIFQL